MPLHLQKQKLLWLYHWKKNTSLMHKQWNPFFILTRVQHILFNLFGVFYHFLPSSDNFIFLPKGILLGLINLAQDALPQTGVFYGVMHHDLINIFLQLRLISFQLSIKDLDSHMFNNILITITWPSGILFASGSYILYIFFEWCIPYHMFEVNFISAVQSGT